MKIYRARWNHDWKPDLITPYFTSKQKAMDCFWEMLYTTEYDYILEDAKMSYSECAEDNETFKQFIYNVLNGWDICCMDEAEFIN